MEPCVLIIEFGDPRLEPWVLIIEFGDPRLEPWLLSLKFPLWSVTVLWKLCSFCGSGVSLQDFGTPVVDFALSLWE